MIGLWRGSVSQVSLASYEMIIGQKHTVQGVVAEDIDTNASGLTVLRLTDIVVGGQSMEGSVWATIAGMKNMRRNDIVTLTGTLQPGFGSFAATMYRANLTHVSRPEPGDVALEVRDEFAKGVRRSILDPEASLGLGYLVGQRRGLPEDLDTALKAAGLTHIVVASGYNLTILVRLARRVFARISKFLSLLASSGMIIGFIAITGMSPSMSRAGLVAGLSLIAWYYGRRFHPLVLLPLAMAVTVLVKPGYAWGDLGWQLSFAAFAGVMILAPLLRAYFFGDKPERTLRRIFIETIAATIMTAPIIVLAFGNTSLVAPVANMLILPLVPIAMLLTFIAGISGLAVPMFATVVGAPAQAVLQYMTTTAQFMGNIPWAVLNVDISATFAVMLYVVIVAGCVYMKHATKYDLRTSSLVE